MSEEPTKQCRDCCEVLPLSHFAPAKRARDGRTYYCRACFGLRDRAYRDRRAAAEGRRLPVRREVPDGQAYCPRCATVQPLAAFGSNAGARNGRTAYCKPCHNAKTKETAERLYGSTRNYHLKRRYGLTSADVDAMIAEQGGRCAICDERDPQHVDHDHVTGEVRGVLCSCCNQGLGNFRDRPDLLAAGVAYLHHTRPRVVRLERGVYEVRAL